MARSVRIPSRSLAYQLSKKPLNLGSKRILIYKLSSVKDDGSDASAFPSTKEWFWPIAILQAI